MDDHRCGGWHGREYGRHERYGRPWQIDHADSTIPLVVSPLSLLFFLYSPAVSSFWRTNPASLTMLPSQLFIALHALTRPTCSYPCPCLMFTCLPPWTSGRPLPCSLNFFSLPAKTPSPAHGSSAAQRRSWWPGPSTLVLSLSHPRLSSRPTGVCVPGF